MRVRMYKDMSYNNVVFLYDLEKRKNSFEKKGFTLSEKEQNFSLYLREINEDDDIERSLMS